MAGCGTKPGFRISFFRRKPGVSLRAGTKKRNCGKDRVGPIHFYRLYGSVRISYADSNPARQRNRNKKGSRGKCDTVSEIIIERFPDTDRYCLVDRIPRRMVGYE